jgi:hypothetical protein
LKQTAGWISGEPILNRVLPLILDGTNKRSDFLCQAKRKLYECRMIVKNCNVAMMNNFVTQVTFWGVRCGLLA